jgi:hypothetical protein
MATPRRKLPVLLSAGALLLTATACLTVSYAGAPVGTGRDPGAGEAARVLAVGDAVPLGGEEEEEEREEAERKREEVEHEVEIADAPARAAAAAAETEAEAEKQKKSSLMEDRPIAAVIRAEEQVINARDAVSGGVADPCVHSVALPPAGRTIELRLTKRGAGENDAETRVLREVTSQKACTSGDGFFLDEQRAPAKLALCPSSCAWARDAAYGLRADVILSGL